MKKEMSRRKFLKTSTYLSISAAFYLSGCEIGGSNSTSFRVETNANKEKVLVYIMLSGGNDSFNMLVPNSTDAYNEYATSRSNLALLKADLKPLNGFTDANGKTFGVHPIMSNVQELFNNKKLSFIANVGPLVERTTKTAFTNNTAKLPLGLLSHADQTKHWQTSIADKRTNIGFFGKLADKFQQNKDDTQISMNISLSGTNILQNGINSQEYSITEAGSIGLKVKEEVSDPAIKSLNNALLETFNTIINKSYSDSFEKTFMATTKFAQSHHEKFKQETKTININHSFTNYDARTDIKFTALDKSVPEQIKMTVKAIKASVNLGMNRQTFFIDYYGWDHHDELQNNHKRMLEVLDNALGDLQASLEELGVDDKVITLIGSDFGRTLTSNGNGTDHGWGGNTIVMGKDINGGKVFGEYPSLSLDNSLDIGGGVFIPAISTDEVFAELALWYGVEKKNLATYLPNIGRFYDLNSAQKPLNFTI